MEYGCQCPPPHLRDGLQARLPYYYIHRRRRSLYHVLAGHVEGQGVKVELLIVVVIEEGCSVLGCVVLAPSSETPPAVLQRGVYLDAGLRRVWALEDVRVEGAP